MARWTKHTNLFEKDYIVVPIIIDKQWLLAIVCFPNNVSVEGTDRWGIHNKFQGFLMNNCQHINSNRCCILFFDSIATDSWEDVAAKLRKYLSWEYCSKFGKERQYTKKNMPCYEVNVPQQRNVYDSGLYLLQYVESFFTVRENVTGYNLCCNRQYSNFPQKYTISFCTAYNWRISSSSGEQGIVELVWRNDDSTKTWRYFQFANQTRPSSQ